MGSANGLLHAPEGPEHIVEIAEFWMADSPITVQQYLAVMGHNPSQFDGSPDHPVDGVNPIEAGEFCSKLSESAGRLVRLPSEAEWEYACRAGVNYAVSFRRFRRRTQRLRLVRERLRETNGPSASQEAERLGVCTTSLATSGSGASIPGMKITRVRPVTDQLCSIIRSAGDHTAFAAELGTWMPLAAAHLIAATIRYHVQ